MEDFMRNLFGPEDLLRAKEGSSSGDRSLGDSEDSNSSVQDLGIFDHEQNLGSVASDDTEPSRRTDKGNEEKEKGKAILIEEEDPFDEVTIDSIDDSCLGKIKYKSPTSGALNEDKSQVNFQVPEVGMVFPSEVEAYEFYKIYAENVGFCVRKGKVQRLSNGSIRKRFFYCTRQGFRLKKRPNNNTTKYKRKETRTGCNAKIQFTVKNGEWEVSDLYLVHNHEIVSPSQSHIIRSCRNISDAHAIMDSVNDAGMAKEAADAQNVGFPGMDSNKNFPSEANAIIDPLNDAGMAKEVADAHVGFPGMDSNKIFASDTNAIKDSVNDVGMAKGAADARHVGFPCMDPNNFFHDKKMNVLQHADSQSLIDYLNLFLIFDPSFFYTVRVDAENRITNFFWRDGKSKIDYDYFGDVIIFDTTFRVDIYDMICAPFVGVNHHRQYILLGSAFLLDESTESFIWLFQTFMIAMGGRQPKTIFTDERPALACAIGKVLPETQHRICMWHICQNAANYLSEHYRLPGFETLFNKCIFDCQSKEDFESTWDSLFEHYNLRENSWLCSLYMLREKWSCIFSRKTFSAGIEAIRSGEGINDVFHNLTSENMTLIKFAQQYDMEADQRRMTELYEDLRRSKSLIFLSSSLMEKHAANIYTQAVFKLFQEELLGCLALAIEEIAGGGTITAYKLIEKSHSKESIVAFNCSDSTVTCSCKKFEQTGILCVHSLKVLNSKNIFQIPPQYILKRWTKYAKYGVVDDYEEEMVEEKERPLSFYTSKLMQKALNLITKCVAIEDTRTIAELYLKRALEKVEAHLKMRKAEDFEVDNEDFELYLNRSLKKVEDNLKTKDVQGLEVDNEDAASDSSDFDCSETQKKALTFPCVDLREVSKSRMKSQMKKKRKAKSQRRTP